MSTVEVKKLLNEIGLSVLGSVDGAGFWKVKGSKRIDPQMTQIHTDVQTKCCCEFTVLVEVERFFRALDSLAGSVYGLGVWKVRGSKRIDPQMTQIHTDVQTDC